MDFDDKYEIFDEPTPRHTELSGRYKQSFAYYTLRERLPVILTTILDNLNKDKDILVEKYGEDSREEIKTVVGLLSELKYKIQTDKFLTPFEHNEADKDVWNDFINKLPEDKRTFFRTCWLYAECYMYRTIKSFFETTKTLKDFDYFNKQKVNATLVSHKAMEAVANGLNTKEKCQDVFVGLLKLNLWGNRFDLSISSGQAVRPDDNPLETIAALDTNLLIDNTAAIWQCLSTADTSKPVIVDIVCDNAGFELFTDLVVADYIIQHELASKVRFHLKAIPWFISDVTAEDFDWALKYYKESDSPALKALGTRWTSYVETGKFELQPTEYFWTGPYEYYRMRDVNSNLYNKLSEAQLIIFKGDLNYRKLIGDFCWDFTEDFKTCLRGFSPSNLCTLRTIKADLICGLPEGLASKLSAEKPDWMVTGEFGVIQFNPR